MPELGVSLQPVRDEPGADPRATGLPKAPGGALPVVGIPVPEQGDPSVGGQRRRRAGVGLAVTQPRRTPFAGAQLLVPHESVAAPGEDPLAGEGGRAVLRERESPRKLILLKDEELRLLDEGVGPFDTRAAERSGRHRQRERADGYECCVLCRHSGQAASPRSSPRKCVSSGTSHRPRQGHCCSRRGRAPRSG